MSKTFFIIIAAVFAILVLVLIFYPTLPAIAPEAVGEVDEQTLPLVEDDEPTVENLTDLIQVSTPIPEQTIFSPLELSGQARGFWFFEATFPVSLVNWDGLIIGETYATAQGDWMTEEFVPFSASLEFTSPVFAGAAADHFSRRGTLFLHKDNPSGLPEYDNVLEVPVKFSD
jgi:hypothetical protein